MAVAGVNNIAGQIGKDVFPARHNTLPLPNTTAGDGGVASSGSVAPGNRTIHGHVGVTGGFAPTSKSHSSMNICFARYFNFLDINVLLNKHLVNTV